MNVDDLICVGATGPILLSSTIGRNKNKIPGEVLAALISGTEEVLAELRANGIDIRSTGGETADVGDLVRTIIVDSTVVARLRRDQVVDNAGIKAGQVIVGLSSYGQASYESDYNGGMGSNGLTSARHDVFHKLLAERYPESFDPEVPAELVYSGTKALTDAIEGSPLDAGKLVLSPTRTYAPIIAEVLKQLRPHIGGMVHCSGGAQTKVLHFATEGKIIKDHLFPFPRFSTSSNRSLRPHGVRCTASSTWATAWKSMWTLRMRSTSSTLPATFNVEAQIIGRVEPQATPEVHLKTPKVGEIYTA